MTLQESERITILKALRRNKWKKMATARELAIDKNTLRRKIARHNIQEKVVDFMENKFREHSFSER
jgi:transcriptional regulator of acetoin/glycerol metabolism